MRTLIAIVLCTAVASAVAETVTDATTFAPDFRMQTGIVPVRFDAAGTAALALAGRRQDGRPMLALVQAAPEQPSYREIALPDDAVAIDVGEDNGAEHLFVLAGQRVLRLTDIDGELEDYASVTSLYRGRSLAELRSDLDFARDVDGDRRVDLIVPDFEITWVRHGDGTVRPLELPSARRAYEQVVTYRPAAVTTAPAIAGAPVYTVRGDTLFTFVGNDVEPARRALPLGLSPELELEAFYNNPEDIDQRDVTLREIDRFVDVNGDTIPDILTLETLSEGVFDKTTTYRIHHGRVAGGSLEFDAQPDTVVASKGFQFDARFTDYDAERKMFIAPNVRIGVRAIIGALFSRAVTLAINVHVPDGDGVISADPVTTIKTRIRFDFGSGQAEFPTIQFGDVDGDGRSDLVLKSRRGELSWRRALEDGNFDRDDQPLGIAGPTDGSQVHLVDLDGDGRVEIVVRYGRGDDEALVGQLAIHRLAADIE